MKKLRLAVVVFGLFDLILTLGYYFRQPWATDTWPWPVSPLDYLLVSSFLAGATVVILWLGLVGEWGAAAGATMNVGLMNAGAAAYLFHRYAGEHEPRLLHHAIAFTVFASANAGVLLWSIRQPIRDTRKIDRLLHVSFVVFSIVLLIAAVQLLRRSPTIFPWTLEPDTSTMFGWLFLGSAVYFIYGTVRPSWHNMRGQLLAFLAYDLVLLPTYVSMYPMVEPEHRPSLRIYLAVLFYSSVLAIYYLFIAKKTRVWKIQT
jgi:magnesium-transporting ATPase (P-type)